METSTTPTAARSGYIDADTHVMEPLRAWDYLDPDDRKYRPVPVVTVDDGPERELWIVGDQRMVRGSRTRVANSGGGIESEAKDLTDVPLRLKWMDRLGVDVQLIMPTFFLMADLKKTQLEVALAKSYNRWMADVWAESNNRLNWAIVPAVSSMPETLQQMEFGRDHGGRAVLIRALEKHLPPADPYFLPMYAKAQELDLPVVIHVGNADPSFNALGGAQMYNTVALIAALYNLLVSDIPTRFPKLRFGFLEASSSWLPFIMHRLARQLKPDQAFPRVDGDLLKEKRLYVACMSDEDLPYLVEQFGSDTLVLGSDFGHTDLGTDVEAHRLLAGRQDLDETTKNKILRDNARALYGLN